jgi:hypothetical protein
LDQEGYLTVATSTEDAKKAEKRFEERGQFVAATWTHVAGLGWDPGYSPCCRYLYAPEGRA